MRPRCARSTRSSTRWGRKLRRIAGSDERLDEAKQIVRQVLVVKPRSGDAPSAAVGDYSGRGELGGWLRIALGRANWCSRSPIARSASPKRGPTSFDAVAGQRRRSRDRLPEDALSKRIQKESFAPPPLALLDADERRLLRYSVCERLSIDDIARLDGVHRATAARQVARARVRLTEETRRVLGERLKLDTTELQSVLRLIESQVERQRQASAGRLSESAPSLTILARWPRQRASDRAHSGDGEAHELPRAELAAGPRRRIRHRR